MKKIAAVDLTFGYKSGNFTIKILPTGEKASYKQWVASYVMISASQTTANDLLNLSGLKAVGYNAFERNGEIFIDSDIIRFSETNPHDCNLNALSIGTKTLSKAPTDSLFHQEGADSEA